MPQPASRRFMVILAMIVLAGFGLRVVYVLTVTRHEPLTHLLYDARYYEEQSRALVRGEGFVELFDPSLIGKSSPGAEHPPLTVFALVPAALIDDFDTSLLAMRLTMVVVGTTTIALIGLLTRRLMVDWAGESASETAGETAGVVAAMIAALDPNLWVNDGLIMSESLSVLITVVLVALTYRVLRAGATWPTVAALGVLSGLGILTRAEFALLIPFLVLPAVWVATRDDRSRTVRCGLAACVAALLVVAPWCLYNVSRFEKFTTLSTNDGIALGWSNCESTYYGEWIGWADPFNCPVPRDGKEQSVWNAENRSKGLEFISGHITRIPVVALARLGRAFNVYRVGQSAYFATGESRPEWATWMGAVVMWMLLPLSIVGGVVMRRRRQPIWPLVVPVATTAFAIAFLAGGLLRYRAPTEPSFVILGAIGLVALFERAKARGGSARA